MKKIMWIIMIVLILPIVFAPEPSYYLERSTRVNLKINCFDTSDSPCDDSTTCQITILYPNQTSLITNGSMTWNSNYFNYTLSPTETSQSGEYSVTTICQGTEDGFSTFTYEITEDGLEPTNDTLLPIIIGLFLIALFFIVVVQFTQGIGLKIFGYGVGFINILMIGFLMYINELYDPLYPILRLYFWVLLILGFGISTIITIIYLFRGFNVDDTELEPGEKWIEGEKWLKAK